MSSTISTSASSANTLIVLDWDNTLFPTKAIQLIRARPGEAKWTKKDAAELCALSAWVYRVLRAYIAAYSAQNIRIVTAARRGWVESSLKSVSRIGRWSEVAQLISSSSIEIVCPDSAILPFKKNAEVLNYKLNAFVSAVSASRPSMLLSVGDSDVEFQASRKCAEGIAGMCVGRVKLQSRPSFQCMTRQCQFVLNLCAKLKVATFNIDVSARARK